MSAPDNRLPLAVVFGCEGLALSDAERDFFRETNPLGLILFARNCDTPDQIKSLVADFKSAVGRDTAPVLIDQEGGRVARLKPPHWREAPPAATFAKMAKHDPGVARIAASLNARLLAHELLDLGITVDCAPVLDVPQPESHGIIGDRAAGETAEVATDLGAAACLGFLAGGVLPVIKHIPGHGRALVDSHENCPVVDASLDVLADVDFPPFKALNAMPWAMTAHVVYTAIDPENPATISKVVIGSVIRGAIGFDGVLVSDDLNMKALGGTLSERARRALDAGCDVVLHCSGAFDEMVEVAAASRPLSAASQQRVQRADAMRQSPDPIDFDGEVRRLETLIKSSIDA